MANLDLVLHGNVTEELAFIHKSVTCFFDSYGIDEWQDFVYGYDISIPDDFCGDVQDGATKVVMIPDSKDYVIKIPFYGQVDDCDIAVPFMGAVSPMIETDEPNNYCALEEAIYDEAVKWGIEKFFVPTVFVGDVRGVPIYVQTRITNIRHKTADENTFKYASVKGSEEFDCSVGAQLVEFYTLELVEKLLQFFKAYAINDVDNFRNGGFVPKFGRHVFWDYAGFRD